MGGLSTTCRRAHSEALVRLQEDLQVGSSASPSSHLCQSAFCAERVKAAHVLTLAHDLLTRPHGQMRSTRRATGEEGEQPGFLERDVFDFIFRHCGHTLLISKEHKTAGATHAAALNNAQPLLSS